MRVWETTKDLRQSLGDVVKLGADGPNGTITVNDPKALRSQIIDDLVTTAVFSGSQSTREMARWLIRETALAVGVVPASIHELYMARGRGETSGYSVPALNLRAMVYDSARAALRAARKLDNGLVVLELARSEIEYTYQDPAEYATVCIAAAVKEGWQGPLFLQGDHYQVRRSRYAKDPQAELGDLQRLIRQALAAGLYNIDIDASTLVDLDRPTVPEQQEPNYAVTASLVETVRRNQPSGVMVSIGGEIGEVGGHNTTVEELDAYMAGLRQSLKERGIAAGISKLSVQTGTRHGGFIMPDGSIGEAEVDFDTLRNLSREARTRYGLSGAVQHGASTLPEDMFHRFPSVETAEVHLATAFQDIVLDHPAFPKDLAQAVRDYVFATRLSDRQKGETEPAFLRRNRKFAHGPLKRKMWELPAPTRDTISATLEERFAFLYDQLKVAKSRPMVAKYVKPTPVHAPKPTGVL